MDQQSPFEILLQLFMLDSGIVPTSAGFGDSKEEVKAYMATLSPEDRRRSARKFRKMWKKAAHQALVRGRTTQGLTSLQKRRRETTIKRLEERVRDLHVTPPFDRPTRKQQRDRAHMVLEMLMRDIRIELAEGKAKTRAR